MLDATFARARFVPPDDSSFPSPEALSTDLAALLMRQLSREWAHCAWLHFGSRLRVPSFALVDVTTVLARWVSSTRTIEVSRTLVLSQPWGVVVEVLKHEMAHQYVDEVLRITDESSHGPSFREVCTKLGIDAAASGLPQPSAAPSTESRVLERIRKLLSLAGSANVHEAESAMRNAQRLMLEHNVTEVRNDLPRGYTWRHLGKPTARRDEHERLLAALLHEFFFVETIVVPVYRPREGKPGSILEVIGTETNVAMAEYVHAFLLRTADALWRAHKRAKGIRGDRDRRTFLAGVIRGFTEKLEEERSTSTGTGLVWVGDPGLDTFFRKRHPRVHRVTSQGRARNASYADGKQAGKSIVLHRPLATGPSGGGPKLLTRG